MTDVLWELRDVRLGRGRTARLQAVSLRIPTGVTAVLGPSGAGKTSLLNVLVEFEPPDDGSVTLHLPTNDVRLPLAWVPPDFGLWPHLSVRQHLEHVRPDNSADMDPAGWLASFGLEGIADAPASQLSQGERSRLSVARALCSDPLVLVMDEPLVHVDPMSVDGYWRVIREYCRRRGVSVVFSTHSPEVTRREADWAVCLTDGRVDFEGPVETLYAAPPTERLANYLGPANWFEGDDVSRWLTEPTVPGSQRLCVRPEQLTVCRAQDSALRVLASRSLGTVAETELEHAATHDVRTIVHRPCHDPLTAGTSVLLKLCVLLVLCLIGGGCQQSAAGPQLDVTGSRTFKTPADGSFVPAPRSLTASPDGELYVLDNAGRVLVYSSDGVLNRQWRMPEYDVGKPEGVCILSDGTVAVADTHYHRIVVFDQQGEVLRMFGELGEGPGQFIYPVAITRDDAQHVYVAEYGGNDRIQKFTEAGEFVAAFGSFGTDEGQFQRPSGIVWVAGESGGSGGKLYIADAINNRVHVYSDGGEYLQTIVDSARESSVAVDYPYDLALGPDASLYLAEYGAGRVTKITRNGELIGRYGNVGRGEGQFYTPWGIAVDSRGRVYVADTGNHRTVELSL
ncbi:MAG: ATP-binding cassette domain-containing protein [Planctomycetaceae bacterium]|nr:ATP-binding cassette domain-containing protein [Planctomycetaceae bacterium]